MLPIARPMPLPLPAPLILLLLLLAGQQQQQQQVAHAWWFGASEPAATTPAPPASPQAGKLSAQANFDMDGVKGAFKFSQASPQANTLVEYELTGLRGNNKLYHVHVRPVPPFDANKVRANATAIAQLCGDPATGGHLNPHHVTEKLPPKSAPFDRYELGDLSGKHGPLVELAGQPDRYKGSFTDDRLPLAGEHGIVGRSVVIHKNAGARWVCASIEAVRAN